uniref:Uncharacterized protein n=1 Tax=Dicentrarchus labrax TaxID=13489 RepID=A0A8C4H7X3_DICLA
MYPLLLTNYLNSLSIPFSLITSFHRLLIEIAPKLIFIADSGLVLINRPVMSRSSHCRVEATAAHCRAEDLAGVASKYLKVKRIRHEELDSLIKAFVTGGGVNSHIHKSVTVRRGQQKTA